MVQPIPRLFKNHLMGLFLELNLLVPYGKQGKLRSKGAEQWNAVIATKQNYSFIKSKIKGTTTIELSVNPVNTLQVEKQRGKKLTVADKLYLNELREKYIKHCNINDNAADRNDCASKKRCSVSLDRNADE